MAWFSKKIKAHYINHDRLSGVYTLMPCGAEPSGNNKITAVPCDEKPAIGAHSLGSGGHFPFGVKYIVDISDPENKKIVGVEPYTNSVARGERASALWSIIPAGLWSTVRLASQKVGELLNCGFRSAGDDMLSGPHNNGSTSLWGAAYGHTLSHAFLKASEMASVQTFVYDDLTRIKGTNFQLWTGLGERDISTTGNTATESIEETHLIHESLGRNRKEEHYEIYQGFADKEEDKPNSLLKMTREEYDKFQEDAKLEDDVGVAARLNVARVRQRYEQWQNNHPRILPRHVRLNGYLGHGELDQVVKSTAVTRNEIPGYKASDSTGVVGPKAISVPFNTEYPISTHQTPRIPASTGLSEIQRAADGRVRISSAKSIGLVKEISIPVPTRVASDVATDAESFEVPKREDTLLRDPQESTELIDRRDQACRAHDREFVKAHPEWEYPEVEGDVLNKALEGEDHLPVHLHTHRHKIPPHVTLEVDEQTNSHFYKGRAGVFITDDGGIVLRDAYGSSIRMTGGNIYMDCPGDIVEIPGRDKVVLAGRNASHQSQGDTEIVSATGNTRIKAEKQLSMLGGAHEVGGVLIESKAVGTPVPIGGIMTQTAGLVVKSPSFISIESPDIGIYADHTAIQRAPTPLDTDVDPDIELGLDVDPEELVEPIRTEVSIDGYLASIDCSALNISGGHVYGTSLHTRMLNALDGDFGGRAQEAVIGGGIREGIPPILGPVSKIVDDHFTETTEDIIQEVIDEVDGETIIEEVVQVVLPGSPVMPALIAVPDKAYGFVAPTFNFSYNSGIEYGLVSIDPVTKKNVYNFEIMEPVWQSRERLAPSGVPGDVTGTLWESPGVKTPLPIHSQPYPGYLLWNSPTSLKKPTEFAVDKDWTGDDSAGLAAFMPAPLNTLRVNTTMLVAIPTEVPVEEEEVLEEELPTEIPTEIE